MLSDVLWCLSLRRARMWCTDIRQPTWRTADARHDARHTGSSETTLCSATGMLKAPPRTTPFAALRKAMTVSLPVTLHCSVYAYAVLIHIILCCCSSTCRSALQIDSSVLAKALTSGHQLHSPPTSASQLLLPNPDPPTNNTPGASPLPQHTAEEWLSMIATTPQDAGPAGPTLAGPQYARERGGVCGSVWVGMDASHAAEVQVTAVEDFR